jgi:hypothetical protein
MRFIGRLSAAEDHESHRYSRENNGWQRHGWYEQLANIRDSSIALLSAFWQTYNGQLLSRE